MKKFVLSALMAVAVVAAHPTRVLAQTACPATSTPVTVSGSITGATTWTRNNIYLLSGFVYVRSGGVLTIEPGTIIKGDKASKGSLIVEPGGQILANGTAAQPIVFTSNEPAGSRSRGDWGGVIILGRAPVNLAGTPTIEGGVGSTYGGNLPNDNSGVFRYVRIEFSGIPFQPNSEINGLTMGGVGAGTTISHVQVHSCGDDSFEWFGGSVNAKYLISNSATDDDFDSDNGFTGRMQYGLAIRGANVADVSGSTAFESDNDNGGSANTPQTAPVFSNFTALLQNRTATANFTRALHLRRNTAISVFNSVFAGWPQGLFIDGAAAQANATAGTLVLRNNMLTGMTAPYGTDPTSGFNHQAFFEDANRGNQRGIEAWLRIGGAANVGEVKAAVSETLGIPWVNTIAADRYGDALHADITAVPNVSADKAKTCATPIAGLFAEFAVLLDGSKSSCDWDVALGTPVPGLMPASDQAATVTRSWLTNSNDSYWISNPAFPHPRLSPVLGKYGMPLSLRTRSNFTETPAFLAAGKVDHARAEAFAFANRSLAADMVVSPLLQLCAAGEAKEDKVARGCAALGGWDRRYEASSRGAALFRAFWPKAARLPGLWAVPFDAANPVNTPRDLATDKLGDKLLLALGEAVANLDKAGIALDAPWGAVQRVMVGNAAIPIHGGPGGLGVLNVQESLSDPAGLTPRHGTSYIQVAGFDDKGPVVDAILSYSESTDPASPHASDQTSAYAAKQWHRLPFHAKDIKADAIGKPKRIAE